MTFNNKQSVLDAQETVEVATTEIEELWSTFDCLAHSPATSGSQKASIKVFKEALMGMVVQIEEWELKS